MVDGIFPFSVMRGLDPRIHVFAKMKA